MATPKYSSQLPHPPVSNQVDDQYLGVTGVQALTTSTAAFLGCAQHGDMTAVLVVVQFNVPGHPVFVRMECDECATEGY